nr:cytidine deaminase [Sphingomonas sp. NFR15]
MGCGATMNETSVLDDMMRDRLVAAARAAARNAHAPYSRFGVGAAVLLADGGVVTGANFENASYGLSLCAETVALATASGAGRLRDVVAVAVIGGAMDAGGVPRGAAVVGPCGRCRQVINEAAQMGGRDVTIWCAAAEGDAVERYTVSELLPHAFGPADLGIGV